MTYFGLALVLFSTIAVEQSDAQAKKMLPGLWELNFQMKTQSGKFEQAMNMMQQQLASMPPEQRKMMEQMMAQQGMGIGDGINGIGKNAMKVCVTKEQIEKNQLPQADKNCTQEVIEETDNKLKVKFHCSGSSITEGEGEVTFLNPKAYVGKAVINTTMQGKPEKMTMEQSGKWQSEDCGDLRPVS